MEKLPHPSTHGWPGSRIGGWYDCAELTQAERDFIRNRYSATDGTVRVTDGEGGRAVDLMVEKLARKSALRYWDTERDGAKVVAVFLVNPALIRPPAG